MRTRIKYIDQDNLKIRFSTFIFNVESINEKFGSLTLFAESYGLTGETNGRIFYLFSEIKPTPRTFKRFENSFSPIGLKNGEDYFYFYAHPESEVELDHPSGLNISWLESKIKENGNFVCFKDSETKKESRHILSRENELPPKEQITFKILDSLDPKPDLPRGLFKDVTFLQFISPEDNCYPFFIATPIGIFPEDVLDISLEGQKIAVAYSSLLDGAITIYQIENGERKELKKYKVITGKYIRPHLSEIKSFNLVDEKVKEKPVEDFYKYGMWSQLEKLNIDYNGCSLSYMYQQVNTLNYKKYVEWSNTHRKSDLVDFIRSRQAKEYFEIYKQLENCRRRLYKAEEELPSVLEEELDWFPKIFNPYRTRSFNHSELPQQEEISILTDMKLCICYNNHININSFESWILQGEIISEFKRRNVYVKNEYLLMSHANPIEIKTIFGTPVLIIMDGVTYRTEKDIPKIGLGPSNPVIIYEHYYGIYNRMNDLGLIEIFNNNVGVKYWGMGRAAVIRGIRAQLKKRNFDTSTVNTETTFGLKYCVILDNKKLIRLGDLPLLRISPILMGYLQKCYPAINPEEIEIIKYDLEYMKLFNSAHNKYYEIPINDLIKRQGEMKSTTAPENI